MAYEGNTNAASYITAGIAGADALTSNLKATKSTDFTKLSNAIGDARALKKKTLIEGDLQKTKAKYEADKLLAKGKAIQKAGEDSKPRMAGMLAAFTLNGAGGYLVGAELKKEMNRKSDTSYYDRKRAEAESKILPTDDASIDSYINELLGKPDSGTTDETSSGGSGKKDSGGVTEPVTGSTFKPKLTSGANYLSGLNLEVAEAVGATEGGKWGYDAINQGGTAGGYKAINSGSYSAIAGIPLTSLTIKEVMDRQSGWDDRSITDAQWRASGTGKNSKIWAAGNFQFIPSTLKSVVASSGIDVNRKFDKATQQELFIHHAKQVGSFQPWYGTHGKGFEQKYADFFK